MARLHPLVSRLVQRRKDLGLTQVAVAELAGLSMLTLSNWETGRAEPLLPRLCSWSMALGLRVALVDPAARVTVTSDPERLLPEAVGRRRFLGLTTGRVSQWMRTSPSQVRKFETCTADPRLWSVCAYVSAVELALRLVYDRPADCSCDPYWCRFDESGVHCVSLSCAWCMDGRPASERECRTGAEGDPEARRRALPLLK